MEDFKDTVKHDGLEAVGRFYGLYRGTVYDNRDPDFHGRLMVNVPQIYGEGQIHQYWAWGRGQFAGNNAGMFVIPNVGDGIWVTFENGDVRFPVWEHGWFVNNEIPTAAKNRKVPTNRMFQSYAGHRIEFDDEKMLIRITSKFGDNIELNSKGISSVSKNISLGSLNKSKEQAVLGNSLKTQLANLCTQLSGLSTDLTKLQVVIGLGLSGPPSPAAIASLTSRAITITGIKNSLDKILSNIVTLD